VNYLFDINHPAQVHLLVGVIKQLKNKRHNVVIISKRSEIINDLLLSYDLQSSYACPSGCSLIGKVFGQLLKFFKTWQIVVIKGIDIGVGTSYTIAQVSKFTSMHSIILDDDDDDIEPKFVKFAHSYADCILSPSPISRKSKATLAYNGIHELAYLHPNRFRPTNAVFSKLGIEKGHPYFVLRFVAFRSHHDTGHRGLSLQQKQKIINYLTRFGKVFISAESSIEVELEQYRLSISSSEFHSVLYYAKMFLGDSQTMTAEAAILGTPALKCNTFANKLSVHNELEMKYGLCYSFLPEDFDKLYNKMKELLSKQSLDEEWHIKRQKFISDKIDVTAFLVWFTQHFPESTKILFENPAIQNQFR